MSKSRSRIRRSLERLLFVLFFLGSGGYSLYWTSPLNLITLETTVTGSTWLHSELSGGADRYSSGYHAAFTAKGFVCGFRYDSFWASRAEAENAFTKGDEVTLVLAASELGKAARFLGRDCRTGERIPGTMALVIPSPLMAPRLIEPLDVWRDGWVVMRWLPYRWLLWVFSTLFILIGLAILFAPLIDRYSNPYRKARLGMKALRAFDEEAKQRRKKDK